MSIHVNVTGGTGAGSRKPMRDKPKPWLHICAYVDADHEQPRELAGYFATCPDCKLARP